MLPRRISDRVKGSSRLDIMIVPRRSGEKAALAFVHRAKVSKTVIFVFWYCVQAMGGVLSRFRSMRLRKNDD